MGYLVMVISNGKKMRKCISYLCYAIHLCSTAVQQILSLVLVLQCKCSFNAQWQQKLCKSAGWCFRTTYPTESWYFFLKFIQGIHCFAALGPTLEDIKQRIDVADGKKNALQIDLVTLQNNLNGINRGLLLITSGLPF